MRESELAYAEAVIRRLGRKLTEEDVARDERLFRAAGEYALDYRGDFAWMVDVSWNARAHGTRNMRYSTARGVLNSFRHEVLSARPVAPVAPVAPETGGAGVPAPRRPWRMLPKGYYTVVQEDGGHVTLRLRPVRREGKFRDLPAGTLAVAFLAAGYQKLAFLRPDRGPQVFSWARTAANARPIDALATLLDPATDWVRAGEAYALRSGRCYRCDHQLTDPESLARGLGPECVKLMGGA
jgi:Family of unknown function (DUF6011)